jgi:hypothetical protein
VRKSQRSTSSLALPLALQGGEQLVHFVLGQVLADSIGRVRLAPCCSDCPTAPASTSWVTRGITAHWPAHGEFSAVPSSSRPATAGLRLLSDMPMPGAAAAPARCARRVARALRSEVPRGRLGVSWCLPCERFTAALASNISCITRGRGGWLDLPRGGLPPPILCQLPGALRFGVTCD